MAVKALGGISTADDAFRLIASGASSVELLTGLVYRGWRVAPSINLGLLELLEARGIASLAELRGQDAPSRSRTSSTA
jgi:dihydroorotate dehydrogenase